MENAMENVRSSLNIIKRGLLLLEFVLRTATKLDEEIIYYKLFKKKIRLIYIACGSQNQLFTDRKKYRLATRFWNYISVKSTSLLDIRITAGL